MVSQWATVSQLDSFDDETLGGSAGLAEGLKASVRFYKVETGSLIIYRGGLLWVISAKRGHRLDFWMGKGRLTGKIRSRKAFIFMRQLTSWVHESNIYGSWQSHYLSRAEVV